MRTTVGKLLVNDILPEKYRESNIEMTKSKLGNILTDIALNNSSEYAEVAQDLKNLGDKFAYEKGMSFKLNDFKAPFDVKSYFDKADNAIKALKRKVGDSTKLDEQVASIYSNLATTFQDKVVSEGLKQDNMFAKMVVAGARGKPTAVNSTIGAPVIVTDIKGRPILNPIKNSYSAGLKPSEYWSASHGTRQGLVATVEATRVPGYLTKLISMGVSDLLISEDDCRTTTGTPEDIDDKDNIGGYLSISVGGIEKGSLITPEIINSLKRKGIKKIIVRSPLTCQSSKGICKKCIGKNSSGENFNLNDNAGLIMSSSITEPITQMAMNVKHTGGVAGGKTKAKGLDLLKRITFVPKVFPGAAVLSEKEGKVTDIRNAPQGGTYVDVEDTPHYLPSVYSVKVKKDQVLELGDQISNEGILNPKEIVEYKGLGQGRKILSDHFRDIYKGEGQHRNKRVFDTIARGLINHVEIQSIDEFDNYVTGDVVEYQNVKGSYKPNNVEIIETKKANGFLVEPELYFTAGTKISSFVKKELKDNGIKEIKVTNKAPSFKPVMIRLPDVPRQKDDWMHKLYSSHLLENITESTHRAESSPYRGTSFVHPYARATGFGEEKK